MQGLSYLYHRPSPAELQTGGVRFVMRRVTGGGHAELLTAGEAHALADVGVAVVTLAGSLGEPSAQSMGDGANDASLALAAALEIGMPADRPIYFTLPRWRGDLDASVTAPYLRGVASVLPQGCIGVRGSAATVDHLLSAGLAAWGIQVSPYPDGRWSSSAAIVEHNSYRAPSGDWVTYCHTTGLYCGEWMPGGAVVAAGAGSTGTVEDMPHPPTSRAAQSVAAITAAGHAKLLKRLDDIDAKLGGLQGTYEVAAREFRTWMDEGSNPSMKRDFRRAVDAAVQHARDATATDAAQPTVHAVRDSADV